MRRFSIVPLVLGSLSILFVPARAVEPATEPGSQIPATSCDRINYSEPKAYLSLDEHFGNKEHIAAVAGGLGGKTPEEKLVAIYQWVHSHLTYKADAPYEWRNFDRLVNDGNYGGCADHSVVFGALARACGIPTVWVKTLDVDWIREFRATGKEGGWDGHVFLEVFLHDRWVLLDDVQMVLYQDYDPRLRILPGNRLAYDKGGDPFELILSSRWELWKVQTRAFCRDLDLTSLPVGKGLSLLPQAPTGGNALGTGSTKYPAVFIFYSDGAIPLAHGLAPRFYPTLTHHLTARPNSIENYTNLREWTKPGDTVVLLLLAGEKESIPPDSMDLLPKPWSQIDAEVAQKGAARFQGECRGMHVVALVAKSQRELAKLVDQTQW